MSNTDGLQPAIPNSWCFHVGSMNDCSVVSVRGEVSSE